ncbi:Nicotinate-nucleotide pyrophosphorylase [Halotydeus destructor]|nr:Nicotinate-nucleotide pyrophosphorylase [Halotydeus destructor]
MSFQHILNPVSLQQLARDWINEDLPNFNLQGIIADDNNVVARILCKSPGILAGIPFVNAILRELECSPNWSHEEGHFFDTTEGPIEVARVMGKGKNVLLAERVLLNVLSRCSGVATKGHRIRTKLEEAGWNGHLAGTRKTTPGFRIVEKYGLLVAGCATHRYDLSSMIMLKDNHVTLCGSMKVAIERVKQVGGFSSKIEVESRNLEEAFEAAAQGVDIIMLDNFSPEAFCSASRKLKDSYPNVLIEASGGITEETAHLYAVDSVDIISMSSLVQGYGAIDFSMKIVTK